jgi:hypothetical protein
VFLREKGLPIGVEAWPECASPARLSNASMCAVMRGRAQVLRAPESGGLQRGIGRPQEQQTQGTGSAATRRKTGIHFAQVEVDKRALIW